MNAKIFKNIISSIPDDAEMLQNLVQYNSDIWECVCDKRYLLKVLEEHRYGGYQHIFDIS